jgi:hypothetical protein
MTEYLLGICSAYAHPETVQKRRHRRWFLLQLSQCGHGRLSALKSAHWYGPTMMVPSYTMHAFGIQLLCSQVEFFRSLPFSWAQLFTFGDGDDETFSIQVQ